MSAPASLPPALLGEIPGPRSRALAARLARVESRNVTCLAPEPPIFWERAAGALELAITVMALRERRLPPTANLTAPDPACDLDCVPCRGREAPGLEYALSNSFAFGGSNAALVVRRA